MPNNEFQLDDKDLKIIEALRDHGNWSYKQVSHRTGIPTTTVHSRVKKLEKAGIIKKYTVEVDHEKIGKPLMAYVLLRIDYRHVKELWDFLRQSALKYTVHEFFRVTGDYDVLIKARFEDMKGMDEFISKALRKVPGVLRTLTMVALSED